MNEETLMPPPVGELLTELTKEVRTSTESFIRLDTTVKSEHENMRKDSALMRELITVLTETQARHGERLSVNETRVLELNSVRSELAELKADLRAVEAQLLANTPVRVSWTAVVSSVVAVAAILWSVFG